jgi:hypothetical protein
MILALALLLLAPSPQTPHRRVDHSWTFGNYRLDAWYEQTGGRSYRILKNGDEVFSETAGEFRIVSVLRGKEIDLPEPKVADITADGIPELIIETFPRIHSCCFAYSVFSLGSRFRRVAHLTGFKSPLTFQDLNRDSIYEITGEDWAFTSWYASPRIVFGYARGEYRFARNFMRKPAPLPATLSAKAREFKKSQKFAGLPLPVQAYWFMLDLTYSGNLQAAWSVLDLMWPATDAAGKKDFRDGFMLRLRQSRYWPEISAMNGIS